MEKENKTNQKFPGYDKNYIGNLLKIVSRDMQNNVQMKDVEYLDIIKTSCEQFNEDLGDEIFDDR